MNRFVEDRSVLSRPAVAPNEIVRYGEIAEHVADVRFCTETPTPRPLVLVIHGGFWRPQFDRSHTGPMCEAIALAGWTVASIEYRRVPGQPDAMLNDIAAAIAHLPTLATLVKRHNGKAIAIGHSAGGHLALWAAVQCRPSALTGVLALGPAADLQYGYANAIGDNAVRDFLGSPPSDRRDVDPCQMPSAAIDVTIVHGVQDEVAPLAMSENYLSRHKATRLSKIENCGHFALIDPLNEAWFTVIAELKSLSRS